MSEQAPTTGDSNSQIYGFLCQKTNVFYAFESHETYQQFLQWLATQEETNGLNATNSSDRDDRLMVDEAEQLADFERATD